MGAISRGRSKASVAAALAGIAFYLRLHGVRDPTKFFVLAKVLRGWAKLRPAPADTRRPIDKTILRKLIDVLPRVAVLGFEATLFALDFSWAFFGAFRVGERVAVSKKSLTNGILFGDVDIRAGAALCRLPRSKMD